MRTLRILPVLLLLAACSDTAGPSARAVRLSAEVNDAAPPAANVSVTIENRGTHPLLIPQCGDRVMLTVQRRTGDAWQDYNGDVCLFLGISVPLELAPGATATASQAIREAGRYRVRLHAWPREDPEAARMVESEGFSIP
jgi:hypothetical protein